MPGLTSLVRGAAKGRPYLAVVKEASAAHGADVAVLDGPGAPRLRAILGIPGTPPAEGRGLALLVAVPGHDHGVALAALAAHRAAAGRALALLTGTAVERRDLERRVAGHPGLGMGNVTHVRTLDGEEGAAAALAAVADALADDLPATARHIPALRPVATRLLVSRAARRAAAIGAAGVLPGTSMPALTLLQARLVMDLAVVHDRELGMERGLELAAVIAAGLGWRAVGRGALMLLPGPAFALRGGVAYAGTRAVGEAAARWLAEGGAAADRPLTGLKERIQGAVRRRRGGVGN
ncbi:MAG: hypothetical protein AB1416_06800 [Actinomycetota bacterium]